MPPQVPQAVLDLARVMRAKPNAAAHQILRARSPHGADFLALRATKSKFDAQGLADHLAQAVATQDVSLLAGMRADGLASFAAGSLAAVESDDDLVTVANALRAARMMGGSYDAELNYPSRRYHDRIDVQSHLMLRDFDYVEQILPDLVGESDMPWSVRTELAHPTFGRPGSDWDTWLDVFNEPMVQAGLPRIALSEPVAGGNHFDRLYVPGNLPRVTDGPLVTIVMSVFEPDQSLVTALRSLADQTWTNFEVLVCDDRSSDEYLPFIESAVAMDDRFTLHRMPVNGGTYKIRNYALSVAKGEFLTFQDSDDWAHPLRIERQVRALVDNPSMLASYSMAMRATGDLSVQTLGFSSVRRNLSSLMLRVADVVPVLGGFDTVRKSADSEFADRMRTVFGREREILVDEPLAVVQLTQGSLSRDEFKFGWRHPERFLYRQAFEHWHANIAQGLESPLMPTDRRPFPAPPAHLSREGAREEFDVVVVADWRQEVEGVSDKAYELRALADAGLRVGVLSSENMRAPRSRRVFADRSVTSLAHDGTVTFVSWEGDVHAGLVVVRDAELLRMPRDPSASTVKAQRVVIVADRPTRAGESQWLTFSPADAEAYAVELFGVKPQWVATYQAVADALVADGATCPITVSAWGHFDVSAVSRGASQRGITVGITDLPVIRRDRIRSAAWESLVPKAWGISVKLRDETGLLEGYNAIPQLARNWRIERDVTADEFVAGVDVLVLAPRNMTEPTVTRAMIVAMASGVLLVAPRQYEPLLGNAATYLDEGDNPAKVIKSVVRDKTTASHARDNARALLRSWDAEGSVVRLVRERLTSQ